MAKINKFDLKAKRKEVKEYLKEQQDNYNDLIEPVKLYLMDLLRSEDKSFHAEIRKEYKDSVIRITTEALDIKFGLGYDNLIDIVEDQYDKGYFKRKASSNKRN